MTREESFGVIPLSKKSGSWEVFLIQLKHGTYWGFPKGHAEGGESPEMAALRELKEETNLNVVRYLSDKPLTEKYRFTKTGKLIHKQVTYFVAEVDGTVILQEHEVQSGIWVPFPQAIDKATHPEGKSILIEVEKILSKL